MPAGNDSPHPWPPGEGSRFESELSWRQDPTLPRPNPQDAQVSFPQGAAARDNRGVQPDATLTAVVGRRSSEVCVVLLDGRKQVINMNRAEALFRGFTVLDADPNLLAAAGVIDVVDVSLPIGTARPKLSLHPPAAPPPALQVTPPPAVPPAFVPPVASTAWRSDPFPTSVFDDDDGDVAPVAFPVLAVPDEPMSVAPPVDEVRDERAPSIEVSDSGGLRISLPRPPVPPATAIPPNRTFLPLDPTPLDPTPAFDTRASLDPVGLEPTQQPTIEAASTTFEEVVPTRSLRPRLSADPTVVGMYQDAADVVRPELVVPVNPSVTTMAAAPVESLAPLREAREGNGEPATRQVIPWGVEPPAQVERRSWVPEGTAWPALPGADDVDADDEFDDIDEEDDEGGAKGGIAIVEAPNDDRMRADVHEKPIVLREGVVRREDVVQRDDVVQPDDVAAEERSSQPVNDAFDYPPLVWADDAAVAAQPIIPHVLEPDDDVTAPVWPVILAAPTDAPEITTAGPAVTIDDERRSVPSAAPEHVEPHWVEPEHVEPQHVEAETVAPQTFQPVPVEPVLVDPAWDDVAEPLAASLAEPELVESAFVESAFVEPDVVEPEFAAPEFVAPASNVQNWATPQWVEPEWFEQTESTQPGLVEPEPAEPVLVEPALHYAPEADEPEVDEPEADEPEAVEEPIAPIRQLFPREALRPLPTPVKVEPEETPEYVEADTLPTDTLPTDTLPTDTLQTDAFPTYDIPEVFPVEIPQSLERDVERAEGFRVPDRAFNQPAFNQPDAYETNEYLTDETTVETQFGTVTVPTEILPEERLTSTAVPAISASNVGRNIPGPNGVIVALAGVSFDLAPGDLFIVNGLSGSGTSTLLHCMAGLDPVDSGRISINGEDMGRWSDGDRARFRAAAAGVIQQDVDLVDDLTAVDNASLPLLAAGWTGPSAQAEGQRVLSQLGLADRLDHYPGQLSRGERQRVAVARALVGDPLVVWADDPTSALDAPHGQLVVDALLRHHRRGATVMIVTRDPRFVVPGARVAHMAEGVLRVEDPTAFPLGRN